MTALRARAHTRFQIDRTEQAHKELAKAKKTHAKLFKQMQTMQATEHTLETHLRGALAECETLANTTHRQGKGKLSVKVELADAEQRTTLLISTGHHKWQQRPPFSKWCQKSSAMQHSYTLSQIQIETILTPIGYNYN